EEKERGECDMMNIRDIKKGTTTEISTKALVALCYEVQILASMADKLISEREREKKAQRINHEANRVFAKAEGDIQSLLTIYDSIVSNHSSWLNEDENTEAMVSEIERISLSKEDREKHLRERLYNMLDKYIDVQNYILYDSKYSKEISEFLAGGELDPEIAEYLEAWLNDNE
ncbi:MAG: hypothetical protein Q4C42_10880, partial [Clostridia bacterium]|nr:hypothetical protein [Clostridia bacterium]